MLISASSPTRGLCDNTHGMAAEALYDEALSLDETERAKLARLLLESLENERDDAADESWNETIARRARQIDDGSVTTVSWEDARAELLGELERRRANRSSL